MSDGGVRPGLTRAQAGALQRALAGHGAADDVFDAACAFVQEQLGAQLKPSVYVLDGDRLWLRAQRGFALVLHSLRLGGGLFARAVAEQRTIFLASGCADHPHFIGAIPGLTALVAIPFGAGETRCLLGIESRTPIEPAALEAFEAVAAAAAAALDRLPEAARRRTTASRRLTHAFARIAAMQDADALLELTARVVGDLLELDCVQIADRLAADEPMNAWQRDADADVLVVDASAARALAAIAVGEPTLAHPGEARAAGGVDAHRALGAGTVVGIPFGAHGYVIGSSLGVLEIDGERLQEAVLIVSHAASELASLRRRIELAASEVRYRSIIAALSEGLVVQDATGAIIECNASAEAILGLTAQQMAGVTSLDPRWRAIHRDGSPFPGESHPGVVTLRTGQAQRDVLMGVHRGDGSLVWISINTQPLPVAEGMPGRVVATFADVTARVEAVDRLRHLALHDTLTGLPNRALFEQRLAAALLGDEPRSIAALFLDVDELKPINDELGHAAGDELLREVARRLAGVVRPGDTVARIGGDEFGVLCLEIADERAALAIVGRMQSALATPVEIAGRTVSLSVSAGFAIAEPGMQSAELIRRADASMYAEKQRRQRAAR